MFTISPLLKCGDNFPRIITDSFTSPLSKGQITITQILLRIFGKMLLLHQGPVVQSIVSLTSSLRVISLTVLADSIYNILISFAEKM